jgi:hypothetical protein
LTGLDWYNKIIIFNLIYQANLKRNFFPLRQT